MPEPDVSRMTLGLAQLTRRAMAELMAAEEWATDAGFRFGCIGVLQVVAALEPVSQREVCDRLLLDPSDIVSLIDILERAGMVERRRDPTDRRRYALEVTPLGRLAVDRLQRVSQEASEQVLAALDATERDQLARLLGKIIEHHTGAFNPGEGAPARPPAGS